MPSICFDERKFALPPVSAADEDGLVLIGGRPTPERIVQAYAKGIFPWYNDDSLPLWFSPDPRFVLFPEELHVSRSMSKVLRRGEFVFKLDTAFENVITACATTKRAGQDGTWITSSMQEAYTLLHHQGIAHSAETWTDGELVGGIYGLRLGNVFFGESMFSVCPNASKFAFIRYVQQLKEEGVTLVDCQVHSEHVEALGARLISRSDYLNRLSQAISF